MAVCLLHSYANPAHELAIAERLAATSPGMSVCVSSEVLPQMQEYEGTSTVVINAYIRPGLERYVGALQDELTRMGIEAPLLIMQSNGGVMPARAATETPIYIIESGPAVGVTGALHLSERLNRDDLITFDMGGTTAKVSIIKGGHLTLTQEYEVGGGMNTGHRLMKGAGYIVRVPTIDIAEVGAGGGSIAWLDKGGALQVGPRSAGASPGPITVYAPEGTFVNPVHPGPVAARGLGGFRVTQTVFGALAKLNPDRVPACWGSGELGISIAGYYPDRKPFVFLEFHNVTGTGGGPEDDGVEGGPIPVLNLANTPIELMEAEQPFLVEEYGFLPDTGGPGKHRGALGLVRKYRILAEEATVQVRSDRRRYRPYGLQGGKPGTSCNIYLNPDTDGKLLPSKWLMELKKGDVVSAELAGGGGHGDPLQRDPQAVAEDARQRKVTPDHAREEYGVVLDPDTLQPDREATTRLREEQG